MTGHVLELSETQGLIPNTMCVPRSWGQNEKRELVQMSRGVGTEYARDFHPSGVWFHTP